MGEEIIIQDENGKKYSILRVLDADTKKIIDDLSALVVKKDKIIDEMMKVIIDSEICKKIIKNHCVNYAGENKKTCDNCLKEYFEERCKNANRFIREFILEEEIWKTK